jgi:hypothetical protein
MRRSTIPACRSALSAAAPVADSNTIHPSCWRLRTMSSRTSQSSSTTRTVMPLDEAFTECATAQPSSASGLKGSNATGARAFHPPDISSYWPGSIAFSDQAIVVVPPRFDPFATPSNGCNLRIVFVRTLAGAAPPGSSAARAREATGSREADHDKRAATQSTNREADSMAASTRSTGTIEPGPVS